MAKKSNRKKLIDKLDTVIREIVYIRDESRCQRCGKYVTGQNKHTSHVVPVSNGNYLRWDLLNVKLLCFHCHISWWHKNPCRAKEWFAEKFPARYDYLFGYTADPNSGVVKARDAIVYQFKIGDLEELLEERQEKLKQLKMEQMS